jgi:TRAP-type C4-dicarboxylate transport system permease large subunit
MFLLMGSIAFASGISSRLYSASHTLLGNVRGGLAMATILACAGFAAICGSTSATAAAMGKVALPEMKKYGYADSLATGSVASAGSLGILIPRVPFLSFTAFLHSNPLAAYSGRNITRNTVNRFIYYCCGCYV